MVVGGVEEEPSSRGEDAVHFGENFHRKLEVFDDHIRRDDIKGIIGEREIISEAKHLMADERIVGESRVDVDSGEEPSTGNQLRLGGEWNGPIGDQLSAAAEFQPAIMGAEGGG